VIVYSATSCRTRPRARPHERSSSGTGLCSNSSDSFDLELHTYRFANPGHRLDHPGAARPRAGRPLDLAHRRGLHPAPPRPGLVDDDRLPWERPCDPASLTPARVRRGFRRLRATIGTPASPPKSHRPVPDVQRAPACLWERDAPPRPLSATYDEAVKLAVRVGWGYVSVLEPAWNHQRTRDHVGGCALARPGPGRASGRRTIAAKSVGPTTGPTSGSPRKTWAIDPHTSTT
jgi:hypothetical protein